MTNYLLAGGGTAGHVNPLLALAELIKATDPAAEIVTLGTAEGLESKLVPQRGFELVTIARLPFPRKPSLYALGFPLRYRQAVAQVRQLIRTRKIDVVVGFGGYAAAPAYSAAKREKIPYVIHEANALPGMANKLGARGTKYVGVTFPGTPMPGAVVTGMPLRQEITKLDRAALRATAAAHFELDPALPTLLVTGGSLGARGINQGMAGAAAEIVASGAQVLHIWGGLTAVADPQQPGYRVLQYCDRMDLAFAIADLAVSRAGSTTVSEISGLGIPAVFSPYRHGNGEQALNCRAVVAAGGALAVEDSDITTAWVQQTLLPLLHDKQRLAEMSAAAKTVARLDGTEQLLQLVQRALREHGE
ncbi:UDP-N-acetylglucosamine--N-acetylmuramyl-(pentapeptide) pyrophosphoryl-undecaprenol N-acetylglucosamine transferase [Canibacter oris]|uniref:UDP-N-acetylglucosamine--N-acetylmuramyl-(pentapeptide) pyrophosphoryl-undecaprenol N-acetylglucosamine transferase n=1 Tax=Canibacter oris TaxID=1365628 RepID=A0A840DQ20_9MICO|nr:UDP-N-acetylglucosamine--N-acetylmuramyl-(pentapeptide) pyrophosphoryl-undecaprenol N-acetylglucosamine transferase [Canibacter oris]MBB4071296.1 UDP-N-acetylglucosamine--N-acetylmuramyl-(pentapeptide) pyrophosphoryl-undecaprenol N-acetylglucosamine transferase [Canibacter oris]